ncbi:nitronate monooxygenase [Bacillus pseudomycoides]|uniref:Probable nitronate monooxygenase n=1 Tax=Bacillus pseudomycoides TaxID=64104 RepID=A0AA91VDF7_9BACI|nr:MULTISPECIES: nitronate monooxygenase [Bacillus]PEB54832.1 nitronate monooxygenase [Bacillus sp. AFS098217]PED83207.1 nitronate monooxygenase [Bacillus pseudomycoides]PEU14060.1 nitronate monooxygenase [Bacillus sp. AFS019443]PEU17622.1 nitronate monooxygenase [Bacillus sp. AFS014408]PFW62308.1 nitronate monooxygenase [Bacillus sp. AFS075034]
MFTSRVTDALQIKYPIIQAGMAGAITTPELVAAVSNSGGLGTLGAGYMSPEQIRQSIYEIRELTDKPFAVNLLLTKEIQIEEEKVQVARNLLEPIRKELGIDEYNQSLQLPKSYKEQLQVLQEEKVPVVSFAFHTLEQEEIASLKRERIKAIGTATNVAEAKVLAELKVDVIVGQGSEAGGHRGTFIGKEQDSMIGTFALIPQLVAAVPQVPIVAAGGIMNGQGVVAAFALGGEGVQMGSAFLASEESITHDVHKEAILQSTDTSTTVTRAFSGKYARGIRNAFIEQHEGKEGSLPMYPVQNVLTSKIRQEAARQNKGEYMSLWAGQASSLAKKESAQQIVERVMAEVKVTVEQLQDAYKKRPLE